MKRIVTLFLLVLLTLISCKTEVSKVPSGMAVTPQAEESVVTPNTTDETPTVPKEWEGKKISDIMNAPSNASGEQGAESNTLSPEEDTSLNLPSNTILVELQYYNEEMRFFPNTIEIKVGNTVRWVNKVDYHNKTAKIAVLARHNMLFRSEKLAYNEYYEFTFNETGEYLYTATPYEVMFKSGKVIVE